LRPNLVRLFCLRVLSSGVCFVLFGIVLGAWEIQEDPHQVVVVGTTDVTSLSDSDYVGYLDGRKSLTGYDFSLASFVISLKASLQTSAALSITEAEYMTLTKAAKKGI